MRYTVVESMAWTHPLKSYNVSPFSLPTGDGWTLKHQGWTVRDHANNTQGIGRIPWTTREDAQAWADAHNTR